MIDKGGVVKAINLVKQEFNNEFNIKNQSLQQLNCLISSLPRNIDKASNFKRFLSVLVSNGQLNKIVLSEIVSLSDNKEQKIQLIIELLKLFLNTNFLSDSTRDYLFKPDETLSSLAVKYNKSVNSLNSQLFRDMEKIKTRIGSLEQIFFANLSIKEIELYKAKIISLAKSLYTKSTRTKLISVDDESNLISNIFIPGSPMDRALRTKGIKVMSENKDSLNKEFASIRNNQQQINKILDILYRASRKYNELLASVLSDSDFKYVYYLLITPDNQLSQIDLDVKQKLKKLL